MSAIAIDQAKTIFPSASPALLVFGQRTGSTTAVRLTGTWSGTTPTAFEADAGSGFAACTSVTVGAGTFWLNLPALAAGHYTLALRFTNETATSVTVQCSIGDNFLSWTDSRGGIGFSYDPGITTGIKNWVWDHSDAIWQTILNNSGSYWHGYILQQLRAYLGYPVAIMSIVQSGATLRGTTNAWNSTTGANYSTLGLPYLAESGATGAKAVLFTVGSNDVQATGSTTVGTEFHDALASTKTDVAAAIHGAPVLLCELIADKGPASWAGGAADPDFRYKIDDQRQGLLNAYADASCLRGANGTGIYYPTDNTHPNTEQNAKDHGYRWFAAIVREVYGDLSMPRSPKVSSVTIDDTKTIVRVTFDKALSNSISSSVVGFRVMDDGTAVTISDQSVTGLHVVTLTLESAVAGTCTVSFASAEDAINVGALPVGVAIALPDTSNGDTSFTLPAEPFFASAVTDFVPSVNQFATMFAGPLRV